MVRHLLVADSKERGFRGEVWTGGLGVLGVTPVSQNSGSSRIWHHESGISAVGNVRLDEPRSLSHRVGSRLPSRETAVSDVNLVLAAYSKWGDSFIKHLRGAFAFALWDPKSRRLIAARDPFGREPLFFHEEPDTVAVASELNPLRRLPTVSEELDEARVADFLMFMNEDTSATFYNDIRRLPPGHVLSASPSGTKIQEYRALSPSADAACKSDAEWGEAYREHLFRAVRRSMRGSKHVGTWLSGGLDSSSVTCVARELLPDPETLTTFSLTFDSVPESDERTFIEAVHQEGNYDPHFVAGDEEGPLDVSEEAIDALGEPFTTPNLFLTTALLRAAQDKDIDVALDGFLGDSVTGHGTRRVTELVLKGRWLTAAQELRGAAQQVGPSSATYRRLLRQLVVGPLFLEPLRRTCKDLTGAPAGDDAARSVVQPDLLRRVSWDDRARAFGADRERTPLREQAAHTQEVTSGDLGLAVETAGRIARRFGISLRFPFADEDLISFCFSVPSRQKCRDGWTRVIAREALGDILPEKIAHRYGKASLGPVFKRALVDLNGERLQLIIHDDLDRARSFLRPDAVRELYQRCTEGKASQNEIAVLWNAILFIQWITSRSAAGDVSATRSFPQADMKPA